MKGNQIKVGIVIKAGVGRTRQILQDETVLVGTFSSLLSRNSPDRFTVSSFFLFPPVVFQSSITSD